MDTEFRNILLATDFSKNAWQALHYAASLAKQHRARVVCMHVLPELPKELSYTGGPSLLYGFGPGYAGVPLKSPQASGQRSDQVSSEGRERAEQLARDHIRSLILKIKSEDQQVPVSPDDSVVRIGNPVETILDEIDSQDYDLVVMGRRGHGKLRGPRTGGVALGVVSRSSVPVLVVGTPSGKR